MQLQSVPVHMGLYWVQEDGHAAKFDQEHLEIEYTSNYMRRFLILSFPAILAAS